MSGGVPAGWVLVPVEPTLEMYEAGYDATRLADGTPQFANADSDWAVGSIDVDIPKGGYPRQWLREAARAALQALGERG